MIQRTSLRVEFCKKSYREVFDYRTKFVLPFTGSRYIFLRCANKNTRTDETVFVSCKQDVTSSDFCKKSYREVFDSQTKFVLQFTGSRYIFLCCAKKNTRTDETVFVSCKQDVTSSRFRKKPYREVFDSQTKFVLQFTGSRYFFLRCAAKNTRTDGATDEGKLIR